MHAQNTIFKHNSQLTELSSLLSFQKYTQITNLKNNLQFTKLTSIVLFTSLMIHKTFYDVTS